MRKLGWLLGGVLCVACSLPNLYTGLLLARLRAAFPSAVSYGDLAKATLGSHWGNFETTL